MFQIVSSIQTCFCWKRDISLEWKNQIKLCCLPTLREALVKSFSIDVQAKFSSSYASEQRQSGFCTPRENDWDHLLGNFGTSIRFLFKAGQRPCKLDSQLSIL